MLRHAQQVIDEEYKSKVYFELAQEEAAVAKYEAGAKEGDVTPASDVAVCKPTPLGAKEAVVVQQRATGLKAETAKDVVAPASLLPTSVKESHAALRKGSPEVVVAPSTPAISVEGGKRVNVASPIQEVVII